MIAQLLSLLISNMLLLLQKEKGFFAFEMKKRHSLTKEALHQETFAAYLSGVSEDQFIEDLRGSIRFLKGMGAKSPSGLLDHFQVFLVREFPHVRTFYESKYSRQEITDAIQEFLSQRFDAPWILVQSPISCDESLKEEIRQHFITLYPKSFVVFSLNTQLIGGIRFFINGKVQDLTWFSKVQKIHNLAKYV